MNRSEYAKELRSLYGKAVDGNQLSLAWTLLQALNEDNVEHDTFWAREQSMQSECSNTPTDAQPPEHSEINAQQGRQSTNGAQA